MQWIKIADATIPLRLNPEELETIYIRALKHNRTAKEEIKEILEISLAPDKKSLFDQAATVEEAKKIRDQVETTVLDKIEEMAGKESLTRRGKPRKYAGLSTVIKDIVTR